MLLAARRLRDEPSHARRFRASSRRATCTSAICSARSCAGSACRTRPSASFFLADLHALTIDVDPEELCSKTSARWPLR